MPVLRATPENVERAAAILREGGVVAFPTETVYGLGANAFDARAVARLFEIKQRPSFDPLIVHIANADMLEDTVGEFTPMMFRLSARFWPGPLTLIARKGERIPPIVTAGLETAAVRMPAHPVALELIERAGVPIAAPSANPFGYVSPTRAAHVERTLGGAVDLILDGGPTEHGVESTIVALDPAPRLLRHGAIPREEIERVTGPLADLTEAPPAAAPQAPGGLLHHYAPCVPLRIIEFADVPAGERAGAAALAFGGEPGGYAAVRNLSPSRNLREAAALLFDALQELEALGVIRIDAPPFPREGLGGAIADRLSRAQRR